MGENREDVTSNDDLSFEGALQRLEEIVRQLESGDVGLEESLNLFEKGVGLAKVCSGKLEEAEKRVEVLLEGDGEPQPFNVAGRSAANR